MRQVDGGAFHPPAHRAGRGPRDARRGGGAGARPARAAGVRAPHADRVPGPLRLAQPADARVPDARRTARHPPARGRAGSRTPGQVAAGGGGARPRVRPGLPPRAVRRPAAASRDRAGALGRAAVPGARRTGERAGRIGSGPGAEPARRAAAQATAHLPVHRTRPRGGEAHRGPCRRDVPGQDRRASIRRRAVRGAAASLHHVAPVGSPGARPNRATTTDRVAGGRAVAGGPAPRLPVPPALPPSQEERPLPHRTASPARGRAWPTRRVPLRRGADVTAVCLCALQALTNLSLASAGPGLPPGWALQRTKGVQPPSFEVTRARTLRIDVLAGAGFARYRLRAPLLPRAGALRVRGFPRPSQPRAPGRGGGGPGPRSPRAQGRGRAGGGRAAGGAGPPPLTHPRGAILGAAPSLAPPPPTAKTSPAVNTQPP